MTQAQSWGSGEGDRRGSDAPGSGSREAFFGQLTDWLDDWLRIEPDGTVLACSGKVELGTGTRTALAQIVAEELDVPFEKVHMVMGDTGRTPDEGYTAGSMTINSSGSALRKAAAEARRVLLEMASERLDAASQELDVREGMISVRRHADRRVRFEELMGGKRFNLRVTGNAPLKSPQTYQIVGASTQRAELPAKFTGQPSFIQDVRLPGLLHARLVRPPGPGAQLVALDENSIRDVPGVVQVVQRGNFIGVAAEREEQAVLAAKQLKVEWREALPFPPMQDLYSFIWAQPTDDVLLVDEGDLEGGLRRASKRLKASYYQPYHAHASIGPSCAVADVQSQEATIWAAAPGPYPLRGALAQLLNLPAEKVRLIHVEGAGSYGQNGSDDAAADAALLSQTLGRPVRVQWSREDEFAWEPKAPAMIMQLQAGLDAQGGVTGWDFQVWSPTHTARPRYAGQLLAAQLVSGQGETPPRFSFGAERNARTNYAFSNQRVTIHWLAKSPLRASSFRSLGGAENTFANESFVDELAAAAQMDAVEYRLRYLREPRLQEVLKAAARQAGWESRPSPQARQTGLAVGRGVAFARYENDEAIVACIAFVEVDKGSGAVQVKRVVAHDCGLIINPDGVRNQIEGNVIQSLSRALKEEVKFTEQHITSVDWDSYPILKFSEAPEVEIVLINRPDQPALGAGEPSQVTTAAALGNAIFDATGARLRKIPFTPERVKQGLGAL